MPIRYTRYILDAAEHEHAREVHLPVARDVADHAPPWISAGMTWTKWAAQLDPDTTIVAPNEPTPDA